MVIKMMCEMFNKMGEFINYVFDDNWSYHKKVELWEIVLKIILFFIVLLVISWWLIPLRFLFKRFGSITFHCKKKGE